MKKIMYESVSGGVNIIHPAPKEQIEKVIGPLTDDEYAAHVWERSVPADAINPMHINEHPEDRHFRDAWVNENGKIVVHMGRAREIHKRRINDLAHHEKIESLRIKKSKAIAAKNMPLHDAVHAEIEAILNSPISLDFGNVKNPEELKAMWPVDLKS